MSFLTTTKNADFQGMGTNQLATVSVPATGTLYQANIRFLKADGTEATAAQVEAEIKKIRLSYDGDDIVNDTPKAIMDIGLVKTAAEAGQKVNGVVPLILRPNKLASPEERALYAHGMDDIGNATIEVQCGTLTNIAKAELYVEKTNEPRRLGMHLRLRQYPFGTAATGNYEISTLPKAPTMAYESLHVEQGDGVIKTVNVTVNGNDIVDTVPMKVIEANLRDSGKTPQAGYAHIDFNRQNRARGFLPMAGVNDLRLTVDFGTAPNNFIVHAAEVHNLETATK